MPDATLHLSRLRRALDLDTPTLCRYDVNVTYEGDQSTGHHKELSPTMVFARLLVPEEPAQVDQCSYSQFVTASAEIARFFTTPPAPTQFAIYIGFKSPHQEGTLLECKFCLPQFVQGGWTWDIVGSESLQDAFRVSFTIHFFMNDRRIEISHDTKIRTTSLRIFTSCESLDIEERLLQKLVDSPASKARAYALFVHGRRLFLHSRHANDVQYLDLSIHALSASCAQDRTQSHLAQFDELLCHILFVRCTLPEGDPHVDKAFDALKRFDITPDPGFGESTIYTIFQVLEKHPHPDYITLTFRILAPSICALSRKPPTDPRSLVKVGLLAVHLAPGMKETYTITESALPIMGSLLPHHNFEVFLISRAVSCIHSHIDGVDIGHDVIIAAIDSVRDHHQKHEGVVFNRDLLRTFVSAAIHYLQNSAGTIIMILAGPLHLKRVLSFLDWIISLGPDSEIVPEFYSQSYPHFLPILRRSTVVAVWIHFITVLDVRNKHYEWKGLCMKQLIQLVYRYIECHSIGDDLLAVIEEQMMYPEHGKVVPSSECGLSEEIDDFLKYSLSTKPQDHITLIRVIIATTIARSFGHPIAMKGYQLVMSESSVEMFDCQWMLPTLWKIALIRDMVTPSDAISYVLALGHDELALEWIYRSYGLVWRRIMDFQPPFTQVAAVDSKLADELTERGQEASWS
ncbi:hypothetical protein BDN72DRAFT_66739 [Pluteus cervinus]|uniref:Uncharacterized protein n=1 Tax=Pluteus cervinus TaxID=181527 RepID=A0ACD3APX0_9AGAR|nr:hypothetical protein BDN72DRAFT_66739 [Pluteus cervinus]